MLSRRPLQAGVCALAACLSSLAFAKPVGTLTCASSAGQIKFNVSYFTFGLTQPLNIGSQSSGAGAGKVTFQPLEVHAALSTFGSLVDSASTGAAFQTCVLATKLGDGTQAEFEFKLVAIASLTASASRFPDREDTARYTDVQFEYGAVEVKSSGSEDDGGTGTTLPPGWNITTNQNQ
jgi:hypothetical protein